MALEGVDGLNRANVIIRRRYEASVPRVVSEVSRRGGVYVDNAHLLRSITNRRIKMQLPGPMTMVDTLQDDYYADREVPGWGIEALEAAVAGLKATTAVHICYGYGVKANIEWKQGLGPEWRQYEATFPVLAESTIDQVSLEIAGSRVPLEVLDLLADKSVQAGVIDVATDRVESPDEVAATIAAVADHIPPERIFPSTNCGMVPLTRPVAVGKMSALARGARLAG